MKQVNWPHWIFTGGLMVALAGCGGEDRQPAPPAEAPVPAGEAAALQEASAPLEHPNAPSQGIFGQITLRGTPPPEQVVIMTDQACARIHAGKQIMTRHFARGQGGGLQNVFVYVRDGVSGDFEPPPDVPLLDQVDCMYTPYVMGVMSGQRFQVKNSDPLFHNVNTSRTQFSNPRNKGFNIPQPKEGMLHDVTYHGRELFVQFRCDVHPWMFAFVGVMDHPYFAVTDENGFYSIPDLPPGNYTLEVIHLKAGTLTRDFTLGEEPMAANFTFSVGE